MTILGAPRNDIINALRDSTFLFLIAMRDAGTVWNNHLVRSIAVASAFEPFFAVIAIGDTLEAMAKAIAACVFAGAYFFIPEEFNADINRIFFVRIRNSAVTSLIRSIAGYVSLFENCKAEPIRHKSLRTALGIFIDTPPPIPFPNRVDQGCYVDRLIHCWVAEQNLSRFRIN